MLYKIFIHTVQEACFTFEDKQESVKSLSANSILY